MTEKISILAALEAVTEADLQAIEVELAAIETRRVVLQDAKRLITAKLHPDQVKRPGGAGKPRQKKQADGVESSTVPAMGMASQIKLLIEAGGPMTAAEIVRQLKSQGRDTNEHGVKIVIGRSSSLREGTDGRIRLV